MDTAKTTTTTLQEIIVAKDCNKLDSNRNEGYDTCGPYDIVPINNNYIEHKQETGYDNNNNIAEIEKDQKLHGSSDSKELALMYAFTLLNTGLLVFIIFCM